MSMEHVSFEDAMNNMYETSFKQALQMRVNIMIQAIVTTTFIIGIASSIARSLQKLFHRIMYDNDKFYKCSFWLTLIGNCVFCKLFVNHWLCGNITDYSLIKSLLIIINIIGFLVIKVLLIESQQTIVIRDLVILHTIYIQYALSYPCSYQIVNFSVYLLAYFQLVACKHIIAKESVTINRSLA